VGVSAGKKTQGLKNKRTIKVEGLPRGVFEEHVPLQARHFEAEVLVHRLGTEVAEGGVRLLGARTERHPRQTEGTHDRDEEYN